MKRIAYEDLQVIEAIVRAYPDGISARNIARELPKDIPHRTLQYRLKYLVSENRLVKQGERRWVTYLAPATQPKRKAIAQVERDASAVECTRFKRWR